MTREQAIEKIWGIACEIAKTGNFARRRELDDLAYEYEIFVDHGEEYIAVEDDIAYFEWD